MDATNSDNTEDLSSYEVSLYSHAILVRRTTLASKKHHNSITAYELHIDRDTGAISEHQRGTWELRHGDLSPQSAIETWMADTVIGIVNLESISVLVLSLESRVESSIDNHPIFSVSKVQFVPVRNSAVSSSPSVRPGISEAAVKKYGFGNFSFGSLGAAVSKMATPNVDTPEFNRILEAISNCPPATVQSSMRALGSLERLLTSGLFLFSFRWDLTRPIQRGGGSLVKILKKDNCDDSLIQLSDGCESAELDFFWNYNASSSILNVAPGHGWIVPLIQGAILRPDQVTLRVSQKTINNILARDKLFDDRNPDQQAIFSLVESKAPTFKAPTLPRNSDFNAVDFLDERVSNNNCDNITTHGSDVLGDTIGNANMDALFDLGVEEPSQDAPSFVQQPAARSSTARVRLEIFLIVRRGWRRGGTRYCHRGVDDSGNVANFAETEQVWRLIWPLVPSAPSSNSDASYMAKLMRTCGATVLPSPSSSHAGVAGPWVSFLQIRGSIPGFWDQQGIALHTQLTREPELTWRPFLQHQKNIVSKYGPVVYLSLLAQKGHERLLTRLMFALWNRLVRKKVASIPEEGDNEFEYTAANVRTETGDSFAVPEGNSLFLSSGRGLLNPQGHDSWLQKGETEAFLHTFNNKKALSSQDCELATTTAWASVDFHAEVKSLGLDGALRRLVRGLEPAVRTMGIWEAPCHIPALVSRLSPNGQGAHQTGVVRTNCLDCLDRTNAAQCYIGWFALSTYLAAIFTEGSQFALSSTDLFALRRAVTGVWAEGGDMLSVAYSGSGSILSSALKQGKHTVSSNIQHAWRSLGRFYSNTFEDTARQAATDLLCSGSLLPSAVSSLPRHFASSPSVLASTSLSNKVIDHNQDSHDDFIFNNANNCNNDNNSNIYGNNGLGLKNDDNIHKTSSIAISTKDCTMETFNIPTKPNSSSSFPSHLRVLVVSWNLGGGKSLEGSIRSLMRSFLPNEELLTRDGDSKGEPSGLPDLVVVCVQELVELSGMRVLLSARDKSREQLIELRVREAIGAAAETLQRRRMRSRIMQRGSEVTEAGIRNSMASCGSYLHIGQQYTRIASHSLVGLHTLVLASPGLGEYVHSLKVDSSKTGLGGFGGNKGGLVTRFSVGDSSITVLNVHLTASTDASNLDRAQEMAYIWDSALQKTDALVNDVVIAAGDFNFRVNCPRERALDLAVRAPSRLLSCDPFCSGAFSGLYPFNLLSEAPIGFAPTYKLLPGSRGYDDRRTPSWCDRILFSSNTMSQLQNIEYSAEPSLAGASDHAPVRSLFLLPVSGVPSTSLISQKRNKLPANIWVNEHENQISAAETDLSYYSGNDKSMFNNRKSNHGLSTAPADSESFGNSKLPSSNQIRKDPLGVLSKKAGPSRDQTIDLLSFENISIDPPPSIAASRRLPVSDSCPFTLNVEDQVAPNARIKEAADSVREAVAATLPSPIRQNIDPFAVATNSQHKNQGFRSPFFDVPEGFVSKDPQQSSGSKSSQSFGGLTSADVFNGFI